MAHIEMIGTTGNSTYYHRPAHGAPWWPHCKGTMFEERYPADEAQQLEERGLTPCPACWPEAEARPA